MSLGGRPRCEPSAFSRRGMRGSPACVLIPGSSRAAGMRARSVAPAAIIGPGRRIRFSRLDCRPAVRRPAASAIDRPLFQAPDQLLRPAARPVTSRRKPTALSFQSDAFLGPRCGACAISKSFIFVQSERKVCIHVDMLQ